MRLAEIQAGLLLGRGSLLHSSAAAAGGSGVVFLGPSGAGKSTAVSTLRQRGWRPITEDKTVICRNSDDEPVIYPARADLLWAGSASPTARLSAMAIVEIGSSPIVCRTQRTYFCYRAIRDNCLWADLEELLDPRIERPAARRDLVILASTIPTLVVSYNSKSSAQCDHIAKCLQRQLSTASSI